MSTEKEAVKSDTLGARNVLIAWTLVFLWMSVIFFFSAQSALGRMELPPLFAALRKTGHIVEYAILALLLGKALIASWRVRAELATATRTIFARAWWLGVTLATLYAASDEFHQSFVPNRGAHVIDVIIDCLSATAALGVWYIINTNAKRET